jgi:hypothetical protein
MLSYAPSESRGKLPVQPVEEHLRRLVARYAAGRRLGTDTWMRGIQLHAARETAGRRHEPLIRLERLAATEARAGVLPWPPLRTRHNPFPLTLCVITLVITTRGALL